MAVVFDALTPDGASVALKVVRPSGDDPAHQRARFQREARILEQLDHPSIVRFHGAGEIDGLLYLAMEKIEGFSLLALRRKGPLELEPLIELGTELADALTHLHDLGVIHRDIKPANVLVRPNGRAVLTDFGISGMSNATRITAMNDILGSPGFMAPEVLDGQAPGPASDQFALGRLLFELGAQGPAPRLAMGVPVLEMLRRALEIDWTRLPTGGRWSEMAQVLGRMLETDPADRYPLSSDMGPALSAVVGDSLDARTLSAHVEGLDLQPSWPVETEVDDALLADLERPAGDRGDQAETDLLPPLLDQSFLAPRAEGEAEPTGETSTQLDPAPTETAHPTESSPRRRLTLPPVGGRQVADIAPPPPVLAADEPTPPAGPAVVADPKPAADPESEAASKARAVGVERARLKLLEQKNARLEATVSTLQAARDRAGNGRILIAGAAAASLVLGALLGWVLHPDRPPPPIEVTLLPLERPEAPPRVDPPGSAPSESELQYGRSLYSTAREQLSREEYETARGTLRECISTADLPACHRLQATLLALRGDPGAFRAFQRYLLRAGDTPDAARLRKALGLPARP